MDGPHKFRVTFEIGYGVPSRELVPRPDDEQTNAREVEVRSVEVLAYDAKQAVYQVQIALNKEILLSVRDIPGSKLYALGRQRKQHFVLYVGPVVEEYDPSNPAVRATEVYVGEPGLTLRRLAARFPAAKLVPVLEGMLAELSPKAGVK